MNFQEFKEQYQKVPVEEYPNQAPENPMVSVCVQTYQHVSYIKECLDSILMQKTDFPYEILLGEDASTDGTREICIEYAEKYPDKIRLFLHHRDNNILLLGAPTGRFNSLTNFYSAKGKYLAICEGDDYWTDPKKLQKQVDFMEANTDCSLCFHASENVYKDYPNKNNIRRPDKIPLDNKFEIKDAINGGGGFMATNSMFILKKHLKTIPEWMVKAPVLDLPLMILLASKGKLGYIDEVMSVYNRMTAGSWSSSMQNIKFLSKNHKTISKMWDQIDKWLNKEYSASIKAIKRRSKILYIKEIIKRTWIYESLFK